ncbi:MAG: ribonuclease P protein component [Flavobacterium sp.]
MRNTYPKSEKLKSQKKIELLFSEGKSVAVYPLRLVYAPIDNSENAEIQIGVSASKKYFKKATERNRMKRLLREAYRLNKTLLWNDLQHSFVIMFLYQSKEEISFVELNEKTVQLFEKFKSSIRK